MTNSCSTELRFGINYGYYTNMKAPSWPDWSTMISTPMSDLIVQCGPDIEKRHWYEPSYHPSMQSVCRHTFAGLEKIIGSYSQSMQDVFVLTLLDGKRHGTYLELGSFEPVKYNNTYLLTQFSWIGISIDIDHSLSGLWAKQRPNDLFQQNDALTIDYNRLLETMPDRMDYLQIDIDQGKGDVDILEKILATGKKFSVITFEHEQTWKQLSSDVLSSHGYELLVENIVCKDFNNDRWHVYEDWWIDPSFIDISIQAKFKKLGVDRIFPFELFCAEGTMDHIMPMILSQRDEWSSYQ